MSDPQVPLWVPVVVALLGFVGVLGAQVIAAWRDDRRWRREAEHEKLRWNRERAREQDNRSHEGRREAYAQVISAVESFDWLMFPAYHAIELGRPAPRTCWPTCGWPETRPAGRSGRSTCTPRNGSGPC